MKELEQRAAEAVGALLENVPAIQVRSIERLPPKYPRVDILVEVNVGGRQHLLVCEVKSMGQPRHVRAALLQLRDVASQLGQVAAPIFIAPYLSLEAQALCREHGVGFLDLAGNARIAFDTVFIERQVSTRPPVAQRELKSIFKPKSAQVLRVLLREPARAWRVAELAQAATVSLGHVSNVRTALVDREWAEITDDGLHLSQPDRLLDAWRDVYEPPYGKRLGFYTTLHGQSLEASARKVLRADLNEGQALFSSFSAAHWLAPYGRTATQYFYADVVGLQLLRDALNLTPITSGENVVITVPTKDHGLFFDAVEAAPGAFCTSPVQTYLDLANAGERGREAADHLRQEKLSWQN